MLRNEAPVLVLMKLLKLFQSTQKEVINFYTPNTTFRKLFHIYRVS